MTHAEEKSDQEKMWEEEEQDWMDDLHRGGKVPENKKGKRQIMHKERGDYREVLSKEFEKLGGTTLKKSAEIAPKEGSIMDFRAILQRRATITKRDWGGHCFEYCDKEIASSCKVQDLTQTHAEAICHILKIPLTEDDLEQLPDGSICPCGCGEMLRKGARFRPGHDTRLRCRLLKEYEKTKSKAVLKKLRNWNWERYLG